MRNLVFLLTLEVLAGCQPGEQASMDRPEEAAGADDMSMDPTVSDPEHYKVVFDNDQVRVLRISYGAGEEGKMHSHPASVAVFLADSDGALTMADGSEQEMSVKMGDTMWADAESHQPKATTGFELVQVELKGR